MSTLKWHFPSTDNGEEVGLNDPLRENFEGDHERYVAREGGQNSLDAKSGDGPVHMSFERFMLPAAELPGREDFEAMLELAKDYARGQEGSEEFYDSALEMIRSSEIPVLKISDRNTTGLNGDDFDKDGEWYRLIRATGASSMSGAGGGSFGIGKGAPFAASALRTVFYSTIDKNGRPAFQGKARISSFSLNGDVKRGTGLFGSELNRGVSAIREEKNIPGAFRRSEKGTDIFIIGYMTEEKDWRNKLTQSVLANFWAAIHFGDLVVSFSETGTNSDEINSSNLERYLTELSAAGRDSTLPFYKALVQGVDIPGDLKLLGKCSLFVKKEDGYPKRVQMMRKSKMVIDTTQRSAFRVLGDPFAAVFVCFSNEGNKRLRALEPPSHNEWNPDRDKKLGKHVIRELNDFIRGSLRSLAEAMDNQPEEIPELNYYLPEDDDLNVDSGSEGVPTTGTPPPESGSETGAAKPLSPAKAAKIPEKKLALVKKAGLGGDEPTIRDGTSTTGNKGGSADPEKDGKLPFIDIANITFRARQISRFGTIVYQTVITPLADQQGALKINAVGEDARYPIEIEAVESNDGTPISFEGSTLKDLTLKKDESIRLYIKLASKKKYVIGVGANDSI